MTTPPDQRSSIAVAMAWASRIIAVSLEMVVPGLIGWWIDEWIGTTPTLTIVGFCFGMALAMWQLLKMTNGSKPKSHDQQTSENNRAN